MQRLVPIVVVAALALAAWWLWPTDGPTPADKPFLGPPPDLSAEDLAEHNRGVAHMGRFDFERAAPVFEGLAQKHPNWVDVYVDYGIARLNRSRPDKKDLQVARDVMDDALRRIPGHMRATQLSAILLMYRGKYADAIPRFEDVATRDPEDANAACFAAECHLQLDAAAKAESWYRKAIERDGYLRTAWYGLFRALQAQGRAEEGQPAFETYKRLEANPQARYAEIKYTRMGPHGMVDPILLPGSVAERPQGAVFAPVTALATGDEAADAVGWRRSTTAADLDGDGQVDLHIAGMGKGDGRSVVLLRRGNGFEAQPAHPLSTATNVRSALFGDVDNDGRTDAYLCRGGTNELWLRDEQGGWVRAPAAAGAGGGAHDTRGGALLDIDHDGDLDLVLLHADAPLEVLVNKLDGTFGPLPKDAGLSGRSEPAVGLIAGDLDRDRDLDLIVLHASGGHAAYRNERLWRWVPMPGLDALLGSPIQAGVVTDTDADGRPELIVGSDARVERWAPSEGGTWTRAAFAAGGAAQLAVLDAEGDGLLEVVAAGAGTWRLLDAGALTTRFGPTKTRIRDGTLTPLVRDAATGMAVVAAGEEGGLQAWLPGPGRHPFAAITLSGRHNKTDQMRSNAAGVGTQASVRVGPHWTVHETYRATSGPGQSLQPLLVGTVGHPTVDFVTLLWTDGLLQTESLLKAGEAVRVEETQRQTSSCPVLFVWDGTRFAFVTDFLGVGGVGFWVAPDTYPTPSPQETLLLPPGLMKPKDGALVLKLGEPMEEACYLDGAELEAIDVPKGWSLTVDDRMAVMGPAPTGEVKFLRHVVQPSKASDQDGRDLREALAKVDRRAAPAAKHDPRFIGRTDKQVLTLEFAKPIDRAPAAPDAGNASAVPVLLADGWIEYPYAQTMFSAWQAGASYDAPTIEARGSDGTWRVVHEQYGYPAGFPRRSSVPLPGLPKGTTALRISTNQEIYWDRLAVAYPEACPQAKHVKPARRKATLAVTGFALRTTGAQRLPDYDYDRRAPLWDARHQEGWYTRLGDVEELVAATDDAIVIFGPGEEVELRFDVPPPPPEGFTRWYVLRTTGWCKDMDLFTKDGETLGPLPTRGEQANPARARLHPKYQTRYRVGR